MDSFLGHYHFGWSRQHRDLFSVFYELYLGVDRLSFVTIFGIILYYLLLLFLSYRICQKVSVFGVLHLHLCYPWIIFFGLGLRISRKYCFQKNFFAIIVQIRKVTFPVFEPGLELIYSIILVNLVTIWHNIIILFVLIIGLHKVYPLLHYLLLGFLFAVFTLESSTFPCIMDERLVNTSLASLSECFCAAIDLALEGFLACVSKIMLN